MIQRFSRESGAAAAVVVVPIKSPFGIEGVRGDAFRGRRSWLTQCGRRDPAVLPSGPATVAQPPYRCDAGRRGRDGLEVAVVGPRVKR